MNKKVYHGSPKGDINIIKAHTSIHKKECIYATDDLAVAMMFMGRGNGDLDTVKIYDRGMPVLVERRPGIFEKLYNKPGYIYELPSETFEHYDYLWLPEVVSFEKEIVPIKKEYHENILKSLEELANNGRLKLYKYPDRPEYIPLDNSDLIEKYIKFENQGIAGAITSLLVVYPEFKERVLEKNKQLKRNRL